MIIQEQIGTILRASKVIETNPVGYTSEFPFLNQVIEVSTAMEPIQLLDATQEIEQMLGRKQKSINGVHFDRTCDIDIIFYDDRVIDHERLTLPHPRFREREFVLKPMTEIAPDFRDPITNKTIKELLWDVSSD